MAGGLEDLDLDDFPVVWRTKLRSKLFESREDFERQENYCFENQIVGIGWRAELPDGSPLEDVLEWIREVPKTKGWKGWGPRAASTVNRFAREAKDGDLVWVRDTKGSYRLGQIKGDDYRFENKQPNQRTDIHQVRSCEWLPNPLREPEVPGAVVRAFSGPGSSFSRINADQAARVYSDYLWKKESGGKPEKLHLSSEEVVAFLSPFDLEDLVYVWMQVSEGLLAVPKGRLANTQAFEWFMLDRDSGGEVYVQVKSGDQSLNFDELKGSAGEFEDARFFAFARTRGQCSGDEEGVRFIGFEELGRFAERNPSLLPPRVGNWFSMLGQ